MRRQAERSGADRTRPLGHAIERSGRQDDVLHQHGEGLGVGEKPLAGRAETGTHDPRKGHALKEVPQDWMRTDAVDLKVRRSGGGQHMTAFTVGSVIHVMNYGILVPWLSQARDSTVPFGGSTTKGVVSCAYCDRATNWPSVPYRSCAGSAATPAVTAPRVPATPKPCSCSRATMGADTASWFAARTRIGCSALAGPTGSSGTRFGACAPSISARSEFSWR